MLFEVSLINLFLYISPRRANEGESGVTRSVTDELHSWDIQRDQVGGESGVTRSIIDELYCWDIQRDQMEGESGVTQSNIDKLHTKDIQGYQI